MDPAGSPNLGPWFTGQTLYQLSHLPQPSDIFKCMQAYMYSLSNKGLLKIQNTVAEAIGIIFTLFITFMQIIEGNCLIEDSQETLRRKEEMYLARGKSLTNGGQ